MNEQTRPRVSRRHFVGSTIAAALAGCTGADEGASTETEPIALDTWVPEPESTNGREYYLTSDVILWNLRRIRPFEDALHPEFYDRITKTPDADRLGLEPSDIDARIDVASQSARVYLGQFETETAANTLEQRGYSKDREMGSFELFVSDSKQVSGVFGIGDGEIVVGKGAEIRMAGDDNRSSQITPRTAAEQVVEARRSENHRYANASETFGRLAETVMSAHSGTVRTFEPVSTPEPAEMTFTGCVGIADTFEFSRPKSTWAIRFLFTDPSRANVDPIRDQFEQKQGTSEYDDVSYASDGSTVTVKARMRNERFDGWLPGDPADRA